MAVRIFLMGATLSVSITFLQRNRIKARLKAATIRRGPKEKRKKRSQLNP